MSFFPIRFFVVFCLVWLVLYMGGCSSAPNQAVPGAKLSELYESAEMEADNQQNIAADDERIPAIETEKLLNRYRDLLKTVDEPALKQGIRTRVADLELKQSEDLLVEGLPEAEPFAEAIDIYQSLLSDEQPVEEKVRLQYQLSKAYSLAGRDREANQTLGFLAEELEQQQQPENQFAVESHFRLAEAAFNQGDYKTARLQYSQVVEQGDSDFQQNAYYMLGWSEFKLNRYDAALAAFIQVLDQLLQSSEIAFDSYLEPYPDRYQDLSKSEQNLVEDSLRAMSIAFSYLGGAESIEELLLLEGDRSYSNLLYKQLGALYRSQERYRDAADTYLAYVQYQPFSPLAPEFSGLAIQIYYEGNFPSLILPAKEAFVSAYGFNSLFWLAQDPADLEAQVKPNLHEYLQELSSHYHALAQEYSRAQEHAEAQKLESKRNYLLAAGYYEQFVTIFPDDTRAPQLAFLRAEALYEAAEYIDAADAYYFLAYQFVSHEFVADDRSEAFDANLDYFNNAAYNLILAIDQVLANDQLLASEQALTDLPVDVSNWQNKKLQASIQFANRYPEDNRAPVVLSQAMDIQFQNQEYQQAIAMAEQLLNWQPVQNGNQNDELIQHAAAIAAQAEFIEENYFAAEMRYRELLELLPEADKRFADAQLQIAASLYRQAEELLESSDEPDNKTLAVDHFLAAADFLPQSDIAAVARFDAANHLMDLQDWQASIEHFTVFQEQYPNHDLAENIPAKLAFLYQQTGQWQLAADNLLAMIELDQSADSQTIYLAAQLYQKAGIEEQAKKVYQRYVDSDSPDDLLAMEAQHQLALMAKGSERNRWIEQLIKSPDTGSDRGLYLKAWATNEQADQIFHRYSRQHISLPLKKSLRVKQQVMEETIDAYRKVLDLGVAEFATLASYRMAEVYAGLSQAVINSERPKDLDALALEQYEILLEEQAFPFEEKAIALHEANAQRSWQGEYDFWVQQSFESLGALLPGRYNKVETRVEVSRGIY